MVNALVNGFITLAFFIMKSLGNLIMYPIQILLVGLIPDFSSFVTSFNDFLINTIFPVLAWLRVSILNILRFPPGLWSFFVTTLVTYLIIAPAFRSARLFYNIYQIWKGTSK